MSMTAKRAIRVLCVDDSALIRKLVTEIVNNEDDMEMVATAPDPLVARELIKQHNPDVLTLDVEMPRMDGLDFLGKLMRLRPMPVIMLSSLTERGSDITLQALELGAVDFVTKPKLDLSRGLVESGHEIVEKIRGAARATLRRPTSRPAGAQPLVAPRVSSEKLFIVGASTGGTEAIREFLEPMPADAPAILITQHMPGGFTASLPNVWTRCVVSRSRRPNTASVCCLGARILRPAVSSTCAWRAAGRTMLSPSRPARRSIGIGLRSMSCSNRQRNMPDATRSAFS